jgi:hypothetical protein
MKVDPFERTDSSNACHSLAVTDPSAFASAYKDVILHEKPIPLLLFGLIVSICKFHLIFNIYDSFLIGIKVFDIFLHNLWFRLSWDILSGNS